MLHHPREDGGLPTDHFLDLEFRELLERSCHTVYALNCSFNFSVALALSYWTPLKN